MGMFVIRLSDLPQYAFVRLVQAFGQLAQDTPDARWETDSQDFQLAKHPAEPISCLRFGNKQGQHPYIPSTFSESVLITSSLSVSRHFRILLSD